jgi:L-cystine uptake protein TcyP (sodium:dicarboxylate symporter family)
VLVAAVMSLTVVGLPSQSTFFAPLVAISAPLGVPLEALPLLIAVETLPDIWRTVGNVTADVAATAAVSARERPDSTVAT